MQAVEMLVKGRIDLTLENELVAKTRIQEQHPELLSKIAFVEKALSNNFVYVISSYKNPHHAEFIQAFNKGLQIILKNGTYHQILKSNGLPIPALFNE